MSLALTTMLDCHFQSNLWIDQICQKERTEPDFYLERGHWELVQAVAAPVEAMRRISEIGMGGGETVVM